jgi:hypothetical protein
VEHGSGNDGLYGMGYAGFKPSEPSLETFNVSLQRRSDTKRLLSKSVFRCRHIYSNTLNCATAAGRRGAHQFGQRRGFTARSPTIFEEFEPMMSGVEETQSLGMLHGTANGGVP